MGVRGLKKSFLGKRAFCWLKSNREMRNGDQHLSTPLLLAGDALGAYKDSPVSGSGCRDLRAIYCTLTVSGEIRFAELPWKCITLSAYLVWLIVISDWKKSGLRFPKVTRLQLGYRSGRLFVRTSPRSQTHGTSFSKPVFLAVFCVSQGTAVA